MATGKKIVHICKSDTVGGAAVVTYRLMNALCQAGHDARLLVLDKRTTDARVLSYSSPARDRINFLAERLQIFVRNGCSRSRLFKVDTASWGADLCNHPWIREADVVNINWINQGAMSLSGIQSLASSGKPIVWSMHDMWNCTGICHHAYECTRFKENCGKCPYLGSFGREHDLSSAVQQQKARLYQYKNLHFVAVSHWLEERCRESSIMRHCDVQVVPNAFPIGDFAPEYTPYAGIPTDKTVLVMGAARLDDDVKGFPMLIAMTEQLSRLPEGKDMHLVLFGDIRDAQLLSKLAITYTYLGRVSPRDVSGIYRASHVVLSTSLYETLPGTLIEGMASGCMAVSFGRGGQADIIEHQRTGYIARFGDAADFAQGVVWASANALPRTGQHESMRSKFAAEQVAQRYSEIFEKITI